MNEARPPSGRTLGTPATPAARSDGLRFIGTGASCQAGNPSEATTPQLVIGPPFRNPRARTDSESSPRATRSPQGWGSVSCGSARAALGRLAAKRARRSARTGVRDHTAAVRLGGAFHDRPVSHPALAPRTASPSSRPCARWPGRRSRSRHDKRLAEKLADRRSVSIPIKFAMPSPHPVPSMFFVSSVDCRRSTTPTDYRSLGRRPSGICPAPGSSCARRISQAPATQTTPPNTESIATCSPRTTTPSTSATAGMRKAVAEARVAPTRPAAIDSRT